WILRTPTTTCSRIINDCNSRRFVVVTVSKHPSAKQWDVECAEVGGTDSPWIDLRGVVCFVLWTAFELNRDVVRAARNAGRIQRVSRRHGRINHARLLTHVVEQAPEVIAELCVRSVGIV